MHDVEPAPEAVLKACGLDAEIGASYTERGFTFKK
jgi:hypothetical protein